MTKTGMLGQIRTYDRSVQLLLLNQFTINLGFYMLIAVPGCPRPGLRGCPPSARPLGAPGPDTPVRDRRGSLTRQRPWRTATAAASRGTATPVPKRSESGTSGLVVMLVPFRSRWRAGGTRRGRRRRVRSG
jgi:hypothetical protein